jgi:hypothetical protein
MNTTHKISETPNTVNGGAQTGPHPPQRDAQTGLQTLASNEAPFTFFVNPPSLSISVLCIDIDRLYKSGLTAPLMGRCSIDLAVPPVERCFSEYARVILIDQNQRGDSGTWVNILVESEVIICMFVTTIEQILTYANALCTVCNFPSEVCVCGCVSLPPGRKWSLVTSSGVSVKTQRHLARIITSPQIGLCLELNFDEPQLQSKKTYEQVLSEPTELEPILKIIEDAATLVYQMKRSRNFGDVTVAIGACIRSLTGRSNVYFVKDLCDMAREDLSEYFTSQSDGHWTSTLSDIYDNYGKCKESKLSQRLKKVFNHIIMHCVYHKLNIEVDRKLFERLEEDKIRPNLVECLSFADAVVGLLTFLLKHGRQCMIAGSLEPMFMDSDSVSLWLTRCKQLKVDYEFLGNPGAVGLSIHDFLHRLDVSIEESKSIAKFLVAGCVEQRTVVGMTMELDAMRKRYLSVTAASSVRKQPLGIVLFGTPGVGKSSLIEILHDFDAKRRGRDPSSSCKFQFNASEEYMTNFKSWMHTIVIDDVAQHNPSKIQGIDPGLVILLRFINNQAECPPQAALEDKGKTPILADLVIITTNKHDLNIPIYYPASYAAFRRVPIRVQPKVKEKYRKAGGSSIDPKLADHDGPYPNYWDFEVFLAQPDGQGTQTGSYKFFNTYENIQDFLAWFGMMSDQHHAEQTRWMATHEKYVDEPMCECRMPVTLCMCPEKPVIQGMRTDLRGNKYYVPDREVTYDEVESDEVSSESSGDSIFDSEDEDYTRPWRNIVHRGKSRCYHFKLSYRFLRKYGKRKELQTRVNDYAHGELPDLMALGWTNHQIYSDFEAYMRYREEVAENDEIEDMSSLLLDTVRPKVGLTEDSWMDRFLRFLITLWFSYSAVRTVCERLGKYAPVRRVFIKWFRPSLVKSENQKHFMMELGRKIDAKLGGLSPLLRLALGALSLATMGGLAVRMWRNTRVTEREEPNEVHKMHTDGTFWTYRNGECIGPWMCDGKQVHQLGEGPFEPHVGTKEPPPIKQVLREIGTMPQPAPGDSRVNVWEQKERTVTSLDFMPKRATCVEAFDKRLVRNTLAFTARGTDSGGVYKNHGVLLVLSNECFVTNDHSIPEDEVVHLNVSFGGIGNVRPEVGAEIRQSQIHRIPERDMCIVTTRAFPALFNDISQNFVRDSFDGKFDGFYLLKRLNGEIEKRPVYNVSRSHYRNTVAGRLYDMEVFSGTVVKATELGDCGSPLVLVTGYGPVIVGFHSMFVENQMKVFATKFSFEDYTALSTKMDVQVGTIPVDPDILVEGKKSYVDFHDEGKLMYHGELLGFRSRPKHHVFTTELGSQLYGKRVCGLEIKERLTSPLMDNWRPQQLALSEFIKPVDYMDEVLLEQCADAFVEHILKNLPPDELALLHPYPLDVAVNGFPGMAYVDSIKRSTSMGYPHKTPKRKFLVPLNDERWPDGVKFVPEIEEIIEEWMSLMSQGVRCHGVFSGNLKDEPVSFKKQAIGKTRVFFSGPAPLLVLVRMMFMSFCRVVQRNNFVFFTAVGMDCTSLQWDKLFYFLAKFGVDTAIAGDYAFFDKKVKMLLIRYAMSIVIKVCKASGNFTERDLLIMKVIAMDLMNPTVDFFGMLMTLLGGEVSGHQLTTIFNCIVNVLYLMYSYGKCGYPVSEFFHYVVAIVLGDDHVACVSPERPLFTHTHIKSVMLGLGVDYTMADKESESIPYISLYDASFLKRNFRYDVGLGVHVGPLDYESIFKMLTIQVESKTVSRGEQLAQAITSASMESFLHGREFFDEIHKLIDSCKKSDSLRIHMKDFPCLTWEQYVARFWNTDVRPGAFETGPLRQKFHHEDIYCRDSHPILQSYRRVDSHGSPALAFPEDRIYGGTSQDAKKDCKGVRVESPLLHENNGLSKTNEQMNSIQSDVPDTEGSEVTTMQQTTFVNETVPETLDMETPHDKTASKQIVPAHLADFLSRPAKIATYTWAENASPGLQYSFNPWSLYFNNANIKNKLQNFGLIRCTLHVKFTVNASQFYYGSIGAFYTPMSGYVKESTGATYGYAPGVQVLQSQKPHVWLDPQTTSTSVLELPFLFHRNWLSTLSLNTLIAMGKIDLTQYAALRSANGVTGAGVNIVVYAWAENVELTAPTSRAILQGKKEYTKDGQISGPASTISKFAKKFENLPIVGSYAKATDMVATAVGDVASFFGFTNVPNVRDIEGFKSLPFHTLASSTISEPINKLSLQPKQEVSVDTTVLGDVNGDQLHIANFCGKESFLCGALWATGDSEDKILFTSGVTPELYEKTNDTNFHLYNTPMAHAFRLFTYWRGDIIFRFKIIKTQYHRGRLNVCWDATVVAASQMPGYGNPAVMNMVFDLEDSDELEVRVPYMQALPFIRRNDAPFQASGPYWSNGPSPAFSGSFNGTIQVRVINRLTAPEASSDVDILVFVRAADNIEFAAPADAPSAFTMYQLQSKKEYETQVFGEESTSDPDAYNNVFGERIVSFRELLHRQSKCWTQVIPKNGDWAGVQMCFTMPFQRLPRSYGYDPNGWEFAVGTATPGSEFAFSYVRGHPITWLANCFVGFKGSTNYNFNVINNDGKAQRSVASVAVTRTDYQYNTYNKPRSYDIGASNSTSQLMRQHNNIVTNDAQGGTGMALTNQVTQAGVAVNLPYYTRSKFFVNNLTNYYGQFGQTGDESEYDWYELSLKRGTVADTTDTDVFIDIMCGTGPDFNLIFFLNCPVLTYLLPPTARTSG